MRRWEYLRVSIDPLYTMYPGMDGLNSAIDKWLSDRGAEGWELVSAIPSQGQRMGVFIFKRELTDKT